MWFSNSTRRTVHKENPRFVRATSFWIFEGIINHAVTSLKRPSTTAHTGHSAAAQDMLGPKLHKSDYSMCYNEFEVDRCAVALVVSVVRREFWSDFRCAFEASKNGDLVVIPSKIPHLVARTKSGSSCVYASTSWKTKKNGATFCFSPSIYILKGLKALSHVFSCSKESCARA